MKLKKTNFFSFAGMANLLLLTICTYSSLLHAESTHEDGSLQQLKTDRQNFWHLLFVDVAHQKMSLSNELQCLALNIYFEARSESIEGQHAVGHVVMNRVADSSFPDTICDVVKQGGEAKLNQCQFSWWCDGRPDTPVNQQAWSKSMLRALEIASGVVDDPTHGALWYHADYVNPKWSKAMTMVTKIGQHLFYLSKKRPAYAMNFSSAL
jgi:hypothetical protein